MGQLRALGGLPAAMLAVAGFLAAGAGGQDVADCSWQPEEDQLLTCHLKTLQAGPAVIPQVHCNHLHPMYCINYKQYCSCISLYFLKYFFSEVLFHANILKLLWIKHQCLICY
jgi:hypothetical protein